MESFILLNLIVLWLVVLLLLGLVLLRRPESLSKGSAAAQQTTPLRGQLAPPFTAFLPDQQRVTHAEYLGHNTLFFLLSTTCPHCRNALPEIERVGERMRGRGWRVACVFQAEAEQAQAYAQELGLHLPLLIAPSARTSFAEDYNRSGGVPAFVSINTEGIVVHEGVVNRREEAWRAFVQEWHAYPILARPAALYRDQA